MAQKLDYPKTEDDFRKLQDEFYRSTKEALANNDVPRFKGLVEVISSETVILTAIHKIKANKGSKTPGSDGETMRVDILEKDYPEIISRVQKALMDYKPEPIKRVYIPKPGTSEKRPLGIPAVIDRIIQECVKSVIEPILEAQFFNHSYGFRPMREAHMALNRLTTTAHKTGYHWIIEGDISKFFDNVNHTKLLRKLWHYGIRDRRVLMIIKAMLKAGIMDELKENPSGTPQGGILSPLLANAYLNVFDQWIVREWEEKKTKHDYKQQQAKYRSLRDRSNLKPAYLVRYADDWVLLTSSKTNAEKWKKRIKNYLDTELKLTLSENKTKITNIRRKPIRFLGFTYKVVEGKSKTGYITRTKPDPERLKTKIKDIQNEIKKLKQYKPKTKQGKERLINGINKVNSMIRGVIQYYEPATLVVKELEKYSYNLSYTAYKALKPHGCKWIHANQVDNLKTLHSNYETKIPTITYRNLKIGITNTIFCSHKVIPLKNQDETPYTPKGREMAKKRTGRKSLIARADELFATSLSEILIRHKKLHSRYNFEYYLNRAYAFNRDKGKCKICNTNLWSGNVHIHHNKPNLPLSLVNRVKNLTSLCTSCHPKVHSNADYSFLGDKIWKKILRLREKLNESA